MPVHRILVGEHALGERLADDHDRLVRILAIERIEITAGNDGNAQRRKESGRDGTRLRAWILYTGGMHMAVGRELQSRARAAIAPGNHIAECRLLHAGQSIDATYRFLVEIDDLLRCLPIGHGRNIDDKHVLGVQSCLRAL